MVDKSDTNSGNLTPEDKLALQNDLIQMTVHDLKGPLMEIISNIDLVVNSKNIPDNEREFAQTAEDGCKAMYNLVMDMLDLGKLESGGFSIQKTQINIGALLDKTAANFTRTAEEREIKITVDTDANHIVNGDERLLERVMANLLSNGLKFSSARTTLELSAAEVGDSIEVKVRDWGPGIPLEYRDRVFDKYFQVALRTHQKKGGTGLGLPFCKMVIEAHGGRIGIHNVQDGTEFYFTLPKDGS